MRRLGKTRHPRTVSPAPAPFRQQLLAALPRLRRFARSLLHDAHAADDLVQSTVERALTHWHQYDQQRDLLAWLLAIAHNAHRDVQRRDARMRVTEPEELTRVQDDAQAHAAQHADPGLRLDIVQALASLNPEQRECLLLVSVECLSYAECAEVLRVPIGTVMSRIARARAALRSALTMEAPASAGSTSASSPSALRRVR